MFDRRGFLKKYARTLLATSLWPPLSAQGEAPQVRGGNPPVPGGQQDQAPFISPGLMAPPPTCPCQQVTYVCGRGEVENYFRSLSHPSGYQQDLKANCELRREAPYAAIEELETYLRQHPQVSPQRETQRTLMRVHYILAQLHCYIGNMDKAIAHFQSEYGIAASLGLKKDLVALEKILGIARFRRGQVRNWIARHNPESSLFPLSLTARFSDVADSEEAVRDFLKYLDQQPEDFEEKWFLNLAYMAVGKYPDDVPPKHLIAPAAIQAKNDFGRFTDVAPALDLAVFSMAGSVIMDDFDNDGYLDLVVSTGDHCEPLKYFHNNGDGTFEDRSARAGFSEQLGGFSIFQADYNNDGWMDIYVTRGAWETPVRNSLLRNNGDGTFTDMTAAAGLAIPATAGQAAAWGDYDNDGNVDLFMGNEYSPSQLFHNNGDGTFTDVAHEAGVDRTAFTKGAVWGDFDNDGWLDLYVSNEGSENFLYHNNHDGTFTEVARDLHVETPIWSFPVWFFDYDNDGWLDLYVSSHIESVAEVARGYLNLPPRVETNRLYRNRNGKSFQDVTREVGLERVSMPMGANFGDVDNDGFLDIYLGTGAPSYGAIVPNVLLRNVNGERFVDVTFSSGTGSLQKGHGIAIGNLFHDGQPAIFAQMGGMIPGDRYYSALFKSPGTGHNWIDVRLTGKKTNRAAIGARIKLTVEDKDKNQRNIFRVVTSGGSFGASPLQQHIGLGRATRIVTLEIWWPTSNTRQVFRDVGLNKYIVITEFDDTYAEMQFRPGQPVPPNGRPHTRG